MRASYKNWFDITDVFYCFHYDSLCCDTWPFCAPLFPEYECSRSYFWWAYPPSATAGVRWPSVWGRGNHSRPWKVKCDAAGPLGCASESQLHNELAELRLHQRCSTQVSVSTHSAQWYSVTCTGGVEVGSEGSLPSWCMASIHPQISSL